MNKLTRKIFKMNYITKALTKKYILEFSKNYITVNIIFFNLAMSGSTRKNLTDQQFHPPKRQEKKNQFNNFREIIEEFIYKYA